jgi:hypothetical protein
VPPVGVPVAVNVPEEALQIVKLEGDIEAVGKDLTETITFCCV